MTSVVAIWLFVSLLGVIVVPFMVFRRYREWQYCKLVAGRLRWALWKSRVWRAGFLASGVVMAALVALVSWYWDEGEARGAAIALLIGVEFTLVAVLLSDEYWAQRMDRYDVNEAAKDKRAAHELHRLEQVADDAVTGLEDAANTQRAREGQEPFPLLAPVTPEHQSPTTDSQRADARYQTLKARLVAARLILNLPLMSDENGE